VRHFVLTYLAVIARMILEYLGHWVSRKDVTSMPLTISISDKAARKAREFAQKDSLEDFGLRVGVKGGGCSGLTYTLSIDQESQPTDKVIEDNGIKLFIDKKSYVFLAGTVLEYGDDLNGRGFAFNNPNAKTTCGCGTSFSV
jgi:iron-sulfur cluster assembly protein